jgi:hypothetical protein
MQKKESMGLNAPRCTENLPIEESKTGILRSTKRWQRNLGIKNWNLEKHKEMAKES